MASPTRIVAMSMSRTTSCFDMGNSAHIESDGADRLLNYGSILDLWKETVGEKERM